MRILLLGTKSLGSAVEGELEQRGHRVCRVDTQPLAGGARGRLQRDGAAVEKTRLVYPVGADAGQAHRAFFEGAVFMFDPEVILAAHWMAHVPGWLRLASPVGVLAYHPSLLPHHRGNDSVQKTVDAGKGCGGTVYKMDEGYDTGPVVLQRGAVLRSDDTPSALWRRELFPLGVELLVETVTKLEESGPLRLKERMTPQWMLEDA